MRIPPAPWREPSPDAFQPPIGSSSARKLSCASLTQTAPASTRRAISSPRAESLVQTEAARPYSESFASRTASSASATFITGTVGPNVSSVMHDIVWSTSTSTVGS